jgi:hypothetical protein
MAYQNPKNYRRRISNSHYETDFGVSRAKGDRKTKIGFLKK